MTSSRLPSPDSGAEAATTEKALPSPDSFSVRLSAVQPDRCNAVGRNDDSSCHAPATLVATLVYCNCGDAHRASEACPFGAPEDDPNLVPVCDPHGAAIRSSWECFRRLTTYREPAS